MGPALLRKNWGGEDQGPYPMGRSGEVIAPDSYLSLAFTLLPWESYHNLPPIYIPSKGQGKKATSPEQRLGYRVGRVRETKTEPHMTDRKRQRDRRLRKSSETYGRDVCKKQGHIRDAQRPGKTYKVTERCGEGRVRQTDGQTDSATRAFVKVQALTRSS